MDFSPLGDHTSFPADPDGIRSYGTQITETGVLIEQQVELLRRLANPDRWTSDTADAFRDRAEELASQIQGTVARYNEVGATLKAVADDLEDYANRASYKAADARELTAVIAANPQVEAEAPLEGGLPVITPEGEFQNIRRSEALADLGDLQTSFDDLVSQAREVADRAARAIHESIDDGVSDDWWDRNAGWLKIAGQVLGAIAAVAGLVLLFVVTGGMAYWIALGVALLAGALALAASFGLAAKADGSWMQVAFDALSLLTLGVGAGALAMLSRGFPAVRAAVASMRGGRAFADSMNRYLGVPLRFHSWRASWTFNVFGMRDSSIGSIVRMSDEALDAANAAYDATIAVFPVTKVQKFIDGGREASQMIRQSREMLGSLSSASGASSQLLAEASHLVTWSNIAVVSGGANAGLEVAQLGTNLPSPDISNGVKILTDIVERLR